MSSNSKIWQTCVSKVIVFCVTPIVPESFMIVSSTNVPVKLFLMVGGFGGRSCEKNSLSNKWEMGSFWPTCEGKTALLQVPYCIIGCLYDMLSLGTAPGSQETAPLSWTPGSRMAPEKWWDRIPSESFINLNLSHFERTIPTKEIKTNYEYIDHI